MSIPAFIPYSVIPLLVTCLPRSTYLLIYPPPPMPTYLYCQPNFLTVPYLATCRGASSWGVGSWGSRHPSFCNPFLSNPVTTGGKNDMKICWVPSFWQEENSCYAPNIYLSCNVAQMCTLTSKQFLINKYCTDDTIYKYISYKQKLTFSSAWCTEPATRCRRLPERR